MSDLSGSNWTEIDAGNSTTPPLGWPEGQMPSTVNDCARMMMGALKRMWNRINGVVTTTGGGYTYATANTTYPTAYVTGETYRFKAHRTSTGNDAMTVNSLAAKPLYKRSSGGAVAIGAGDIVAGDMVSVTYDGSLNASAGGFWCGDNIGSLQKTDATVTYVNKSGDTINNFLNVTGQVSSTGGSAGYSFTSRDNGSQQWLWYADANTAHLWMNGGIKMNVDSSGNGNLPGSWNTNAGRVVLNFNGVSYYGSNSIAFTWDGRVQVWVDASRQGHIQIADDSNNISVATVTASYVHSTGDMRAEGDIYARNFVDNDTGNGLFLTGGNPQINGGLLVYPLGGQLDAMHVYGNLVIYNAHGYQPGGGMWYDSSDSRLKKNVKPYTASLPEIRRLRPVSFAFNGLAETPNDGQTYHGLIAQEVLGVMPEMVGTRPMRLKPDGPEEDVYTLNCTAVIYALINAVTELAETVDELRAR